MKFRLDCLHINSLYVNKLASATPRCTAILHRRSDEHRTVARSAVRRKKPTGKDSKMGAPSTYGRISRANHWIIAVIMIAMLCFGL
mgnify:CR=1 FL=1